MGKQTGEGEVLMILLIAILIFGGGFILFVFMDNAANDSCRQAYGKSWHSITKGQFYCEDNQGNLRNTP
jgi:hypothetical protein